MKFDLGCQLNYSIEDPSTFIFNITAAETSTQKIESEEISIDPPLKIEEYRSPQRTRYLRLTAPAGQLKVSYRATAEVSYIEDNPNLIPEVPIDKLPLEVLPYLYPSRYCESDRLIRFVQQEFGELSSGYSRVTAICNWIYDNVIYLFGSTNPHTSAYDTATERAGVCRDFAHLGIAFCRALNIPARFVSGYAFGLEPPDFHARFEAYLGDRWYVFDATRLVARKGLIRIGIGRDAADVSFATIFGSAQMENMALFVEVAEGERPSFSTDAIVGGFS
ncbi:transglutaminase-like domain-containing protein [Baaleninema simplex]|uniref:transglutaminase-like domain-containing protein n=1 Tax=Baaleninema simplex TaxID=2862350 RepID=UPI00034DB39D|nr:transglutaminase family protein [Baaleninema simplex]